MEGYAQVCTHTTIITILIMGTWELRSSLTIMKDFLKVFLKVAGLQVLKPFNEVILKLQIFCTHILNFNNFKSSQFCKLYLKCIVTYMCCNHCNICIMIYHKAMGQRHILTHTLEVHNLGGGAGGGWVGGEVTKFGKFSNFNTIYTQNWCPWNFRDFMMTAKFNTSKIS